GQHDFRFEPPPLLSGGIVNLFVAHNGETPTLVFLYENGIAFESRPDIPPTPSPSPTATPVPTPSPEPPPPNSVEFTFDDSSQGRQFNTVQCMFPPLGRSAQGQLEIVVSNNTNTFGFWESSLVAVNPDGPVADAAERGAAAGSLYRVIAHISGRD